MTVKELLNVAHDETFFSVENDDFYCFSEGYKRDLLQDNWACSLMIDCFYVGTRNNMDCIIIIVKD